MTRVLHRLSRNACPAAGRPWVDALFAEVEAIDSGRARLLWLLGAAGLLFDRYLRLFSAATTPLSLLLLATTAVFAWLAVTEYEGFAFEDDWYGLIAACFATSLVVVTAINLRRPTRSLRP
jgi:amino acid transporter